MTRWRDSGSAGRSRWPSSCEAASGRSPGATSTDQQCRVVDHDWVYRELFLYDLGALRHFLQRVATPDLLAGADRVAAWAASPMGGYRFVGGDATDVSWEDLADGEALAHRQHRQRRLAASPGTACSAGSSRSRAE